ncbi:MAG TPA: SemiSWEET family transporter [Patescibacteria group bacterium]|nr:SemiSWEET family transporter [Patescibacteria group bacterium]
MTLLPFLASISGTVLGLSGFPQVIKIFKTKSAKDIAPLTYLIIEIGSTIWILYGLELKIFPIVLANILGFTTTSLILIGYYLYGRTGK